MLWFISLFSFIFLLILQPISIYGGDSGDLATAGFICGVPHPPGYPLYTVLACIISKFPIYTPAWRIALLSSIPHTLTIVLIFLIIKSLTKSRLFALFGSIILLGNYVFVLYSIVPEVFALNSLFLVLLIYVTLRFLDIKKIKYYYLLLLVFGFSLSHHHIILFIVPAIIWGTWDRIKKIQLKYPIIISSLILFLFGLIPYIYIPLSAIKYPIINWDGASSLNNFINIVTRSRYGTFQSGFQYGEYSYQRFLQLKAYLDYFLNDFTVLGLISLFIGFIWIYKKNKHYFKLLIGGFISYSIFYFFYASYPLYGSFNLAIYERFLLPSYVLGSVIISCGFYYVLKIYKELKFKNTFLKRISYILVYLILIIYPITNLYKVYIKFEKFRNNSVIEKLASDAINQTMPKSILILSGDNLLFGSQYVRYALNWYSDRIILYAGDLNFEYYYKTIHNKFPNIKIPDLKKDNLITEFIILNSDIYHIYTNVLFKAPDNYGWIKYGLLFKLEKDKNLPTFEKYIRDNDRIWNLYSYNNIQQQLSEYPHLFLKDTLNYYADSRFDIGKELFKAKLWKDSKRYFNESISISEEYGIDEKYKYLGLSNLYLKDCIGALNAFQNGRKTAIINQYEFDYFEGMVYRLCYKDDVKAKIYLDRYEKNESQDKSKLSDF